MDRDCKSVLTSEQCPLVAELKLKTLKVTLSVTFSISALSPEGAFQMLTHFYHLLPLGQKSIIHIFDRRSGCKIIKQNVSCLSNHSCAGPYGP